MRSSLTEVVARRSLSECQRSRSGASVFSRDDSTATQVPLVSKYLLPAPVVFNKTTLTYVIDAETQSRAVLSFSWKVMLCPAHTQGKFVTACVRNTPRSAFCPSQAECNVDYIYLFGVLIFCARSSSNNTAQLAHLTNEHLEIVKRVLIANAIGVEANHRRSS